MDKPNPYVQPNSTEAPIRSDLLTSKSKRIKKFQMAALLLFGAFFIYLPTIIPPGDLIRDIMALGMTAFGLLFLGSAIFTNTGIQDEKLDQDRPVR